MRMRKKKNGEKRLFACREFLATAPDLTQKCIWLEIGAGKGGFACQMAERNPEVAYYAMERVSDCVTLAAERAKAINSERGTLQNLKFIVDTADNLSLLFKDGSLDAIYLNFSDPWSKKGYAKRRLTHRRYLKLYLSLLKDGGFIRFKTDNEALFDFSLEEIEALKLNPEIVTRDLHNSEYNENNIRTEYEESFASLGYKINMLQLRKPVGYNAEIPPELTVDGRKEAVERYKKDN